MDPSLFQFGNDCVPERGDTHGHHTKYNFWHLADCTPSGHTAENRPTTSRDMSMTILLLFGSNIFMTFAWYGHLRYGQSWPLWKAILISWAIALIEYCLAVPANRLGFGAYTGFQLKIIQEAITLTVFLVFAVVYLKEKMAWNYAVSFALLIAAVVVAFAFKPVAA
jgi:uncharacterized protein